MADAADGICPRNENVSFTDGSTCTLKINADDTGDASSDACGCAAPDGRELGKSKKWVAVHLELCDSSLLITEACADRETLCLQDGGRQPHNQKR